MFEQTLAIRQRQTLDQVYHLVLPPVLTGISPETVNLSQRVFVDQVSKNSYRTEWFKETSFLNITLMQDVGQPGIVISLNNFNSEKAFNAAHKLLSAFAESHTFQTGYTQMEAILEEFLTKLPRRVIPKDASPKAEKRKLIRNFDYEIIGRDQLRVEEKTSAGRFTLESFDIHKINNEKEVENEERKVAATSVRVQDKKISESKRWHDLQIPGVITANRLREIALSNNLLEKDDLEETYHIRIPFMVLDNSIKGKNATVKTIEVAALFNKDTLITVSSSEIPDVEMLKRQLLGRARDESSGITPGALLLNMVCQNMTCVREYLLNQADAHEQIFKSYHVGMDTTISLKEIQALGTRLHMLQDPMITIGGAFSGVTRGLLKMAKIAEDSDGHFVPSQPPLDEHAIACDISAEIAALIKRMELQNGELKDQQSIFNTKSLERNSDSITKITKIGAIGALLLSGISVLGDIAQFNLISLRSYVTFTSALLLFGVAYGFKLYRERRRED